MASPVTVYLDSQDYSRFGDVLRGKGDAATESLLNELKARRSSGQAVFALSMPILGELLQYDEHFRETTLCKAEAVEQLCGPYALAFPTRLVAREIAEAAQMSGLTEPVPLAPVLNSERYWYPNIGDQLESFKADLLSQAQNQVLDFPLPNRTTRRAAKKLVRKANVGELIRQGAPEMAEKLGLPVGAITGSIGALLRGAITSSEASKRLFKSVCEPRTFVELYFERLENDRSLPEWMLKAGEGFAESFAKIKKAVEPLMETQGATQSLKKLVAEKKPELAALAFKFADGDLSEFGIDDSVAEEIKNDPALRLKVNASQTVANMLEAYILQVTGVTASNAKIERSFGGDMIHAFYVPYVDLWRGDRRFSEALFGAMPMHKDRVVRRLTDLPSAIDRCSSAQGN
jgi:hypothetical protein